MMQMILGKDLSMIIRVIQKDHMILYNIEVNNQVKILGINGYFAKVFAVLIIQLFPSFLLCRC